MSTSVFAGQKVVVVLVISLSKPPQKGYPQKTDTLPRVFKLILLVPGKPESDMATVSLC